MNQWQTFLIGIAPDHVPALLAGLLLPVAVLLGRRLRPARVPATALDQTATSPVLGLSSGRDRTSPGQPRTPVRAWAAWLLGVAAVVHLALPIGHSDGWLLTAGFLGSGAAFAWLAVRAWEGRTWRLWSGLLLGATLLAYLLVAGTGQEEPDQVGILTALVELLALGLCLMPVRRRRFLSSTAVVAVTFVVGAWIWVGSFAAHAAAGGASASAGDPAGAAAGIDHSGHDHGHDHAARAQAGVIMRPATQAHPTADQVRAADALALATRQAMARYASLDAALAAGYTLPLAATGPDVHLDNKAYASDGRVLDPQRPEKLVYAIEGGRATLLGVVFVMERAGVPGPEPGGPITRWHAHNACLTVLPPGFTIVDAFGTCPALSVSITTPEMMHVWVVDSPAGWFAEGLDKEWVRAFHAAHGLPFTAR